MAKNVALGSVMQIAKNNLVRLRTIIILLTILFIVWSISLGISMFVYGGVYLFLIP